MAHLDVVPVDESAPWQHPPFGAEIHDGAIWGRGTLDDKGCVVAICEAVERLLEGGRHPGPGRVAVLRLRRGGERHGGDRGRRRAHPTRRHAVVRARRGRRDRAPRRSPASSRRSASIGVTEKGTTSVELRVEGRGGHASTPARNGPTARLARAILRIDRSPFPASRPGADRRAAAAARPVRSRARCEPDRPTPTGSRPSLTRALVAAGPEAAAMTRTTVRDDDAVRLPRPQRDRQQRPRRAQHPDHGRRHRRRRARPPAQGDQGRRRPHRGRRAGRGRPVSPIGRGLPAAGVDDRRACSPTRSPRRT